MSNASDFELQGRRLKSYVGNEKSVIIPDTVWEISSRAFDNNDAVEEIIVSSSVFILHMHAFADCKNLSHVVRPGSIEKIEVTGNMYSSAFYKCPKLLSAGPVGGGYHVEFGWQKEIPGNAIPRVEKLVLPIELEALHPNALLDFGPGNVDCEVVCPGETFSLLPPSVKMNVATRYLSGKDPVGEAQLKLLTAYIKKSKKKCLEVLIEKKDWQAVGRLMEVCKVKAETVDEYIQQYNPKRYKKLIEVLQKYKETCKPTNKKVSSTPNATPTSRSEKMEADIQEVFANPEFITMEDPDNNEIVLLTCSKISCTLMIPDGITYINEGVGYNLPELVEVYFPKSVRTVDFSCFQNCTNLEKARITSAQTQILGESFSNCPKLRIHAPAGSYAEQYAKENHIPFVAE